MPWCEECAKYLTPTSVREDGTCPVCGRTVGEVEQRAAEEADAEGVPWHFKLLVAALVVYLAWRFVQMIGWLL